MATSPFLFCFSYLLHLPPSTHTKRSLILGSCSMPCVRWSTGGWTCSLPVSSCFSPQTLYPFLLCMAAHPIICRGRLLQRAASLCLVALKVNFTVGNLRILEKKGARRNGKNKTITIRNSNKCPAHRMGNSPSCLTLICSSRPLPPINCVPPTPVADIYKDCISGPLQSVSHIFHSHND